MFNFRIISTPEGQVIDTTLKTPYNSISGTEMIEYMAIEYKINYIKRLKRKERRELIRKEKLSYKLMHNIAHIWNVFYKAEE